MTVSHSTRLHVQLSLALRALSQRDRTEIDELTVLVGPAERAAVFADLLEHRTGKERHTTFLVPRKSLLSPRRQRHYDDILNRWVRFLNQGRPQGKRLVDVRVTDAPFQDLYTTALSEDRARFNVRFLDSDTTRDGKILEVSSGTSLYLAVRERYSDALEHSISLWRVWPWRAIRQWVARNMMTGVILAIAIILSRLTNPIASIVAALATKVAVNILADRAGIQLWGRQQLFAN